MATIGKMRQRLFLPRLRAGAGIWAGQKLRRLRSGRPWLVSAAPGDRYAVNIITEAKGWVLYHWAEALAERLPYVAINTRPGVLPVDYFLPYYEAFNVARRSPIRIGYFTHEEVGEDPQSERKRRQLWESLPLFDVCISQNGTLARRLAAAGARRVLQITPGVDPGIFRPRLVVGFIGRLYENDRKNIAWVRHLQALDWMEVRIKSDFCHWSVLGREAGEALASFYRGLDCVVVTSRAEGGPMCVVEGLACGVPVLMPRGVGLYDEFPGALIVYEPTLEALVRALEELYRPKQELARRASQMTLDGWAERHDRLFRELLPGRPGVMRDMFTQRRGR